MMTSRIGKLFASAAMLGASGVLVTGSPAFASASGHVEQSRLADKNTCAPRSEIVFLSDQYPKNHYLLTSRTLGDCVTGGGLDVIMVYTENGKQTNPPLKSCRAANQAACGFAGITKYSGVYASPPKICVVTTIRTNAYGDQTSRTGDC